MVVGEVGGDHTGSLHVGSQQTVNISTQEMTVLPFNIQTYKVQQVTFYFLCGKKLVTLKLLDS
jgi:hypothetical protein